MNKPRLKFITVMTEDIAKGVRESCTNCPLARAIARRYGGCQVSIDTESIFVVESGTPSIHWMADLSPEAQQWITAFDDGELMTPGRVRVSDGDWQEV